ncbi:MAG TPA: Glu/Leu/Phe/Val dehydrogenase dimerization domain-containing protein [Actinomycetota bacterium]|nr:Glu/Leu/Phe/Val dehydrogenase dimerization domain-containing protein [Actinomycetota bacterium]
MSVFERLDGEFEEVVFAHDPPTGLRCIIAVHSTVLGPALGGVRCFPFVSEDAALTDVLRLSRAMTYKASAAGLDLGGGKAVIIGDPRTVKTEALLRAYARFVEGLGGRYITAEDVGTTLADMDVIRDETRHVGGSSPARGGSGDPSEMTAYGVFLAVRAAAREAWGDASLEGRRVAVQGVGKVGSGLAAHLREAGATVVVADVDDAAVSRALAAGAAESVAPTEILSVECDVLAPCAMGAVLDDRTVPCVRARVVCGAANNQLAHPDDGGTLADRGILYVPDYVANAGGIINIFEEFHPSGYDADRARASVERIEQNVVRVFEAARERGVTTAEAADALAEERLREARGAGMAPSVR